MGISEAILKRLTENDPTFTYLNLNNQGLNDDDILILCEILQNNTHLISLNLRYNQIGFVGVIALTENPTLRSLSLLGNDIGEAGRNALNANTTLTNSEHGLGAFESFQNYALTTNAPDIFFAAVIMKTSLYANRIWKALLRICRK